MLSWPSSIMHRVSMPMAEISNQSALAFSRTKSLYFTRRHGKVNLMV